MNWDKVKVVWKRSAEGLKAAAGSLGLGLGRPAREVSAPPKRNGLARLCPQWLQDRLARRGWAPPTRLLGLEVDGDRVFAVELRRQGSRVVLERAEELSLPGVGEAPSAAEPSRTEGGAGGGVGAEDARRLVEELARLGFRARGLATVISRERTFERTVQLPPASAEELEAMAALKGERELPLAVEEAYVDFLFPPRPTEPATGWPPASARQPGHLVTLCAAAREAADAVTAPWAEAGLRPRALTVAGHGAWRVLRPLWSGGSPGEGAGGGPGPAVCLLLVRHGATELLIGRDVPLFTRAIFPGGSAFEGGAGEATGRVAAEVARSLRAFAAEFPGEQPERVVLVSRYPVDSRVLEREVGLPVEVPRGLPCAELGVETAGGAEVGLAFASALGAAWEELTGEWERVNFLAPRGERRREAERYRRMRWAAAGAVAAVLVVLVPVVVLGARAVRLALVERELEALAPQVRELEALRDRLELVRPWVKDKELALEVLAEPSEAATAEVYLRTASVNESGAVVLEGFAAGSQSAYGLRDRLSARSRVLSDVTYRSGRSGRDSRFNREFTLTARSRRWSSERSRGGRR